MDTFDQAPTEGVILCASSAYAEKYYFNRDFDGLPTSVKEELQTMCVLYTADIGGIFTLHFDDNGNLLFHVTAAEGDFFYDEIGSVLKIKQLREEKRELLEALELYYKAMFLRQDVTDLLAKR